jgi:hypothetical protein
VKIPIIIRILSGFINIVTCFLGALVALYFQDWFGSGDISALMFWTIPLVVALSTSGKTILALYRTRNKLLRFLLSILLGGLISLGFFFLVYLIIGPWINAFSLPIFYLWAGGCFMQLLFLDCFLPETTPKVKLSKVALGLLAFPLTIFITIVAVCVVSFAISYLTRPAKETYLIPHTFEGKITIVYGEECGINPHYEGNRRVLEIPESGVLITQPEFEAGIIDHHYYFVDDRGNRERLDSIYNLDETTRGVRLGSTGNIGGPMPDGSFSSESLLAIQHTNLYVHNGNSIESDDKFLLIKELVEECRESKNNIIITQPVGVSND